MSTKKIEISLDEQLLDKAGIILDDIGLDLQSAIGVFLRRVVKESNINFLLQTRMSAVIETKSKEENMLKENNALYRSNGEITEEMRDYVWKVFVSKKHLTCTEYQELSREVSAETGMNQGSAYIYFVILSSLIEGKSNTRTMKFADLVFYIKKILKECPKNEFEATLISLELSVPYWRERIPGKFGDKVQNLVNQYKSFL